MPHFEINFNLSLFYAITDYDKRSEVRMTLQNKKIKWILLTVFLSACSQNSSTPESQSKVSENLGSLAVNINMYKANTIVCDPLNGGDTTVRNYTNGIKAELFYRLTGMPRWYSSDLYISAGHKSEQNIFLSDINVPTRLFTEGFNTSLGNTLKDDQNNKLIEYFGLKMQTNIVLSDADEEGYYEFAILSDDGSKMIIKSGNSSTPDQLLINNDGDHPTKMGCATESIRMIRNTMLPIELTYYQGPRHHISNVLMFRKSNSAGQDPSCNKLGNSLYFNPDQNSAPQPAFTQLLSRGWKVLTPNNYKISSDQITYNPCIIGTAPGISDFQIFEVILSDVYFSWKTNIPSTSHMIITEVLTGITTETNSDNVLRLNHELSITRLKPNTQYKAQAVSVSQDLGRSYSSPIFFTTQ